MREPVIGSSGKSDEKCYKLGPYQFWRQPLCRYNFLDLMEQNLRHQINIIQKQDQTLSFIKKITDKENRVTTFATSCTLIYVFLINIFAYRQQHVQSSY